MGRRAAGGPLVRSTSRRAGAAVLRRGVRGCPGVRVTGMVRDFGRRPPDRPPAPSGPATPTVWIELDGKEVRGRLGRAAGYAGRSRSAWSRMPARRRFASAGAPRHDPGRTRAGRTPAPELEHARQPGRASTEKEHGHHPVEGSGAPLPARADAPRRSRWPFANVIGPPAREEGTALSPGGARRGQQLGDTVAHHSGIAHQLHAKALVLRAA